MAAFLSIALPAQRNKIFHIGGIPITDMVLPPNQFHIQQNYITPYIMLAQCSTTLYHDVEKLAKPTITKLTAPACLGNDGDA